jgi:hypothetical protein
MSKTRLSAPLALLTLVIGCAPEPSWNVYDIKAQMVGMSASEASTCVGTPVKKTPMLNSEIWSYTYGSCTVNLEMTAGRVKSVSYSVAGGNADEEDEQCAKIPGVASCLRWVRGSSVLGEK